MTALRAALGIPVLVAVIWLGQVAVSALFGVVMHAGGEAALRPYSNGPGDHALYALIELLDQDRSLILLVLGGAFAATLASFLAWLVASPFVLARLAGRSRAESAGLAAAALPAVAVQTVWHHLLRLALLGLAMLVVGPLPAPLKVGVLAIALGGSATALDLVRTQVTLHGAQRFHIRSAWFAFVRTFTDPRRLAAGTGLWVGQWIVALCIVWLGLNAVGAGSWQWLARGLALVGVFVGVWRMALSATGGPISLERAPSTAASD